MPVHTKTQAPPGLRQRERRGGATATRPLTYQPSSVTKQALPNVTEHHAPGLSHRVGQRETSPAVPHQAPLPVAKLAMTHATMSSMVVAPLADPRVVLGVR
jgi:hypothetical protein